MLHIAIPVQIGQAGRLAVVTAFEGLAHQIHLIGRAVVGAQTGVLGSAAAKLGIHHHRHVFVAANALHVLHEAAHAIGHIGEQALVLLGLVDMGVKSVVAVGRLVDAGGQLGVDHGRHFGQVHGQNPIVHRCFVVSPRGAHLR